MNADKYRTELGFEEGGPDAPKKLKPYREVPGHFARRPPYPACHVFYYPRLNVFRYGVRYPSFPTMIIVAFYPNIQGVITA